MLIDMHTIAAGPPGTLNAKPGDQVDVSEALGELLLQGGFGTRPDGKKAKSKPTPKDHEKR